MMNKVFVLGLLLICFCAHSLEPADFIPKSSVIGDASYLGADLELEAISDKFSSAIRANQVWWESYIKSSVVGPGEKLPYHKKMGISDEEYNQILNSKGRMHLVGLGDVSVSVERFSGFTKILVKGAGIQKEFRYDPKDNVIQTSRGFLRTVSKINQQDENSPTGPWVGAQWKLEDEKNGLVELVAFGKMSMSSESVIYYDIKSRKGGSSHYFIKYKPNE
jgi:hypothetical protein